MIVTWNQLKRRKIVQWTLAYLAGAWAMLEASSFIGGRFGWPPSRGPAADRRRDASADFE